LVKKLGARLLLRLAHDGRSIAGLMVNDLEKQECMDGIMVTTFNLALLWVRSLRILNHNLRACV
jgi:hypothetical protein